MPDALASVVELNKLYTADRNEYNKEISQLEEEQLKRDQERAALDQADQLVAEKLEKVRRRKALCEKAHGLQMSAIRREASKRLDDGPDHGPDKKKPKMVAPEKETNQFDDPVGVTEVLTVREIQRVLQRLPTSLTLEKLHTETELSVDLFRKTRGGRKTSCRDTTRETITNAFRRLGLLQPANVADSGQPARCSFPLFLLHPQN